MRRIGGREAQSNEGARDGDSAHPAEVDPGDIGTSGGNEEHGGENDTRGDKNQIIHVQMAVRADGQPGSVTDAPERKERNAGKGNELKLVCSCSTRLCRQFPLVPGLCIKPAGIYY